MPVTAAPAGGEARVVDSADLMPKVVDFLGVGDAFTPAVSKLWRGAAATLKPRMSLRKFETISASLRADFMDSDEEAEMEALCPREPGMPPRGCPACYIEGYYLEARKGVELQEADLKDMLVGHLPAVIVFRNTGCMMAADEWGSKGEWTVGGVFAAIAANEEYLRQGPSDHNFFEGLYLSRGIPPPRNLPKKYEADYVGRYEVFWGS